MGALGIAKFSMARRAERLVRCKPKCIRTPTENVTTPKTKYAAKKANAKCRGIPFRLSFEEWVEVWGDKIGHSGTHTGDYQMCRIADRGAYEVGNVYIGTVQRNHGTQRVLRREKRDARIADRLKGTISDNSRSEDWVDDDWLPEELRPVGSCWNAIYK